MSAANPLTHFPVSGLPTKLNSFRFANSVSFSLCLHRRCSSPRLLLSSDFLSGVSTNSRKVGLMAERVTGISALGSRDGEEKGFRVLEQEALVDGSSQIRSAFASADFEAILNRLVRLIL